MGQTRMFRDRVVSMEQTLEGGEKNLDFLKGLCREAFPDFDFREHGLDHERDLFTMKLEAADGRRKTVGWTRMVLFDAERLPALVENPISPLRSRILAFLQARALRTEIVVTFRHLEDGWVDTPEPRREKRRGRRGGRDGRGRAGQPGRSPVPAGPHAAPTPVAGGGGGGRPGGRRDGRDGGAGQKGGRPERRPDRGSNAPAAGPRDGRAAAAPRQNSPVPRPNLPVPVGAVAGAAGGPAAGLAEGGAGADARPGGRRRRFRRRRRGRGGAGGTGPGPAGGGPGPAGPQS